MSDNDIGPSGASALANALKLNNTLQKINLYSTLVFGNNMVWFTGVGTVLGDWMGTCTGCNP